MKNKEKDKKDWKLTLKIIIFTTLWVAFAVFLYNFFKN